MQVVVLLMGSYLAVVPSAVPLGVALADFRGRTLDYAGHDVEALVWPGTSEKGWEAWTVGALPSLGSFSVQDLTNAPCGDVKMTDRAEDGNDCKRPANWLSGSNLSIERDTLDADSGGTEVLRVPRPLHELVMDPPFSTSLSRSGSRIGVARTTLNARLPRALLRGLRPVNEESDHVDSTFLIASRDATAVSAEWLRDAREQESSVIDEQAGPTTESDDPQAEHTASGGVDAFAERWVNDECWVPVRDKRTLYCMEGGAPDLPQVVARSRAEDYDRTYRVTTTGGSATPGNIVNGVPEPEGTDYQTIPTFTFVLPAGHKSAQKEFSMVVYDDNVREPYETIFMRLENVTDPDGLQIGLTTIVIDNDQPYIYLPSPEYTGNECDGNLSVAVRLSSSTSDVVTVDFRTRDLAAGGFSATAGRDYEAVDSALTFQPYEVEKRISIKLYNDAHFEADEIFEIVLENPVNVTSSPAWSKAKGKIFQEVCPPRISIADTTALETDPSIDFVVKVREHRSTTISVKYHTVSLLSPTSATSGLDYVHHSGSLFFDTDGEATVRVPLLDDNITEGPETFSLILQTGDADPRWISATGTIVDDDIRPALDLSPARITVLEGGPSVTTKLKLATKPSGDVTVVRLNIPVVTSASANFIPETMLFTVQDWNTPKSIIVQANDDRDIQDGWIQTTYYASGGGYDGVRAVLHVDIKDDDKVSLVVDPKQLLLEEAQAGKSFKVSLNATPPAPVMVSLIVPDPLVGKITLSHPSLQLLSSQDVRTVTVTAVDDSDQHDEAGTLQLSSKVGRFKGPTASLSVDVNDDDTAGLSVNPTLLELKEAGEEKSFTVKLRSPPVGQNATVAVIIPTGLTGKALLAPTSLTFTDTDWDQEQAITVTPLDDSDAQDEAGTVNLSASGGGYDGQTGRVLVAVEDDDDPGLVLSKAGLTIPEGQNETYTVKLATKPSDDVTVAITGHEGMDLALDTKILTFTMATWDDVQMVTVAGEEDPDMDDSNATLVHTASGADYSDVTKYLPVTVEDNDEVQLVVDPLRLDLKEGDGGEDFTVKLGSAPVRQDVTVMVSIPTGLTGKVLSSPTSLTFTDTDWDQEQAITVTPRDDSDSQDEAGTVKLSASGGGYDGQTGELSVHVSDTGTPGLVFTPESLTIPEGSARTYTLTLAIKPSAPVTVRITGQARTDLALDAVTLTFTATTWDTNQTVTVTAGQDDDAASDTATLVHTASGGGYNNQTGSVEITVIDDDPRGLSIVPTAIVMAEGNSDTYAVALETAPTDAVTVTLRSDHSDVTMGITSLRFSSVNWRIAQTVTVHAVEDDDTDDEMATLTHSASGGDYNGETATLAVHVEDGDEVALEVSPESLSLNEGSAGKTFAVSLATIPTDAVTVSVTASSALSAKISVGASSLTFTPADWSMSQTVTMDPEDDSDSADEEGTVHLSASGGGYIGESASVAVTVIDDDSPPRVRVLSDVTVQEDGGSAVVRVGLSTVSDDVITARYTTQDGTATAGADYQHTSGTVTFAAGELEKLVSIPIIDDVLDEYEEAFTLELSAVQGAELGISTGRATIVDDDDAPDPSITPVVYVREGLKVKVQVRLSSVTGKPVTVTYSTRDLTATGGKDYAAASAGRVTIAPGDMGAVIAVATHDDTEHEGREAFQVRLDRGGQTIVTILDNDPLPSLSIDDVTVSEDGGRAQLAVSMKGTSAVRVGVAYATQDGTANAGEDYTQTTGTLVFAQGETVRNVWVPVLRDELLEGDETFTVTLSAPEHAQLLDAEGDVTISDEPMKVSIYDETGTESSDELVMPVRLNFASSKFVSVQFAVTGGTATSDVDYEATQGLVVFETGSTEAQVRIPLIDDDLREGNETVEVTLSNPKNAQIGRVVATGTIVDDETAPGVQVRAIAVSQTEVVFVVKLLAPVGERMTGRYHTVNGTAWAGEDYERMEGVLEFGPGETRKDVRVRLLPEQGSGEVFGLEVKVAQMVVREDVVLGSQEDVDMVARLGRSVAVHVVEAVSERMQGGLASCMPRPYPGQRVRASHMLSGCGMQASGERISVWGRGAFSRLQGINEADVVTASLGADYVLGSRWLLGMMVSRSEATGALMEVTGWYPYVRYGGQEHHVWGMGGAGEGVVGEDRGLRLMAAGVAGTVVRRRGMRLGYEADGFWLGMDPRIGVSRVRAGLEGSVLLYQVLEPYVEGALLHSGGDGETGLGMEAGGGVRVRMGVLQAEVKSRRMVMRAEEGVGEWGYAGMVRYGGSEGLAVQLRPTWGRTHVGTLWQTERPWELYPSDDRRMELEVGYGLRIRWRSVLRPLVGVGLRDRGRDYRIGARVQGRSGVGFTLSGLAMEYMTPYRPVSYGVNASGYVRW